MRITTPEEFRAARAARIEAERLAIEREQAAIEARAQEIVADFDKRLAAGDDVFGRGSAQLIADDARVGALVEETLVTNGWRAVSDREPDDYSMDHPARWIVTVREGGV